MACAALLFAGATASAQPVGSPNGAPALAVERRATLPLDWRVRTLDGTDVSVDAYRGRPIVLNLWATWCTPCLEELGSIAALRDSLAQRGQRDVVFLLVSPERRQRVADFQRRHRWPLPFAVELDPLPAVLGIRAVPSTWLIDRTGGIAYTHRGAAAWDAPPVVEFIARTIP